MEVRENAALSRYELVNGDDVAGHILYKIRDGRHWLIHTELAPAHKGTGVGSFLVRRTLDDLRAKNAIIVPTCPFIGGWIRRHPDYQDLVDQAKLREYKRSRSAGRRRTTGRPPSFDPTGSTVGAACPHVPTDYRSILAPWPQEGCAECIAMGLRNWVHLRVCQSCGHVGCCDSSPGKHGTAHHNQSSHPLIRSYEPGEEWWFCYVDSRTFDLDDGPAAPSRPI